MSNKRRLIEILKEKSVRFGHFVLVSGRESDFYVDGKQTTLDAEGSNIIAKLILEQLAPGVKGIGGLSMGADPVASSVAAISWERGTPVQGFLIRKEAKGHGTGRSVEGRNSLEEGASVCIVEDTTTTGTSLLKAVELAEAEGLRVIQTITVVDRQEGAAEMMSARGYSLEALVTREELEG